ncbi:MAG: hypothetical protein NZM04_00560 [Methylacidiphilales bacterium]|nr:hypothetical protein [Candidatus Methylacidiphilales bacterium]
MFIINPLQIILFNRLDQFTPGSVLKYGLFEVIYSKMEEVKNNTEPILAQILFEIGVISRENVLDLLSLRSIKEDEIENIINKYMDYDDLNDCYIYKNIGQSKWRRFRRIICDNYIDYCGNLNNLLINTSKFIPHGFSIRWFNILPINSRCRCIILPTILTLIRDFPPRKQKNILLIPVDRFMDMQYIRTIVSSWNKIHKKWQDNKSAIVGFLQSKVSTAVVDTLNLANFNAELGNINIFFSPDQFTNQVLSLIKDNSFWLNTHTTPMKRYPKIKSENIHDIAQLSAEKKRICSQNIDWLRVFLYLPLLPVHLVYWGWRIVHGFNRIPIRIELDQMRERGLIQLKEISGVSCVVLSQDSLLYIALYTFSETKRFIRWFNYFINDQKRRYGHTISSYYVVANIAQYLYRLSISGEPMQYLTGYSECISAHSYMQKTTDKFMFTYRPDSGLMVRVGLRVIPVHIEVDGWQLGDWGYQRSRAGLNRWIDKFNTILRYYQSMEWRYRYKYFPVTLIVTEHIDKNSDDIYKASKSIPVEFREKLGIYFSSWMDITSSLTPDIWRDAYNINNIYTIDEILKSYAVKYI